MSFSIRLLVIFTVFIVPSFLSAQVAGKVIDAEGNPLIGVTIQHPASNSGTTTDLEGFYQIQVNEGLLLFRYVGYEPQEVEIKGPGIQNITLLETSQELNTVVVIGYGTQKKKDLTTSVVVIDEQAIKDRPMVSAAEALQGKAAGVQVVQPSGKPGGDIAVRVRGATSVLAGNEPLYVVDGVPTTDIRGLNPTDIATMTVLKDAASAAIYGARAANGVVLITTKRGVANTPSVRFNSYYGISTLRKNIEVLSTKKYRDLLQEIIPGGLDPSATSYTDWTDEVFGVGKNQSYQLAFSGGDDQSRYMVSANYLLNKGIVRPASFDRYSMRVNLDNQLKSWLKVSTSLNALSAKTKDTPDNASSGRGGVIMSALNTPPFLTIYNRSNPTIYDPNPFQPSWENPVAYMEGSLAISRQRQK
jgi:TonB-linked SusC/RagA family outer membrane protein